MADEMSPKPGRRRYDYFDDSDVSGNIAGGIVRGSAFVFGSSIAKFLIGLGGTAVLARLLDPEAYGLLAMVFVVTNFLVLFRDLNLSLATVQKDRITHEQVSTIYWINMAVTLALSAVTLASAPLVAWAYDEPRLAGITALLSLSLFIRGFSAQHTALLRRKMRFGAITTVDVGSLLAGYGTGIVLAYKGYGYWALVWMHIGKSLGFLVLSWVSTGWRPGLPVRGSGVRSMVLFGGNLTGYSIVRYTSRSLDNALIGWLWGAEPLGIYSKSRQLLGPVTNYLTSPIGAVAIPSLSRLTGDTAKYKRTFCSLSEKIARLVLPVTVAMIVTANELVGIVLGPKWVAAGVIVQIMSAVVFTEAISGCANWLFVSQGRGSDLFRFGVFQAAARILAVFIGFKWGILGIAAALTLTAVVINVPAQIWYACRSGPVRQADFYAMLLPAMLATATGLGAVFLLLFLISTENPFVTVGVTFAAMAVVQLLFLPLTRAGRETLRDIRRGMDILLGNRKTGR